MKIFPLRHGESVEDVEDRYGGIADYPLTENGRADAAQLADRLRDQGVQVVYTSPFRRASETAEIIAKALECPVQEDDGCQGSPVGVIA